MHLLQHLISFLPFATRPRVRASTAGPQRAAPRLEELETRLVLNSPSAAPSLGAPPPPGPNVVWVNTVAGLQQAVANAQSGETIVIQKGTYNLTSTLYLGVSKDIQNVTIRGATDNWNDVVLEGKGMDNANYGNVPMGISIYNGQNITIADLTIANVYYDPIELKGNRGADSITIYHDHLVNAGEQFIKVDPNATPGMGVNNSSVEYSTLEYTAGPPTTDHGGGIGYTNGIDVHNGANWVISNNLFQNFHVPDTYPAKNLWNPAVLIWDHSSNATVEGNTFINTDRAIAFGLNGTTAYDDNQGGLIANNFIYMSPGLFSAWRKSQADAPIIVWNSPGSEVAQNTILTNGNTPDSIQVRFASTQNIEIANNLADAPILARNGATDVATNNYLQATPSMFRNPSGGNLHLVSNTATQTYVIGQANTLPEVPDDWDGNPRPIGGKTDIGADQYS